MVIYFFFFLNYSIGSTGCCKHSWWWCYFDSNPQCEVQASGCHHCWRAHPSRRRSDHSNSPPRCLLCLSHGETMLEFILLMEMCVCVMNVYATMELCCLFLDRVHNLVGFFSLYMMMTSVELYASLLVLVTVTHFQGHRRVWKNELSLFLKRVSWAFIFIVVVSGKHNNHQYYFTHQ